MSEEGALLFRRSARRSTWLPTGLPAHTSLSNGNRTATQDGTGAAPEHISGTRGRSAGKHYFEIAVSGPTGGVGLHSPQDSGTALLGQIPGGWALRDAVGDLRNNATTILGGLDTLAGAGVIRVAVDLTAHKLWIGKVGGNWNGNAAYDPDAGTGGVPIPAGTYYPAVSVGISKAAILNTGQDVFAGVKPATFYIWE